MHIRDKFGRSFKKLRISLTDQCNLACTYCVDEETSGVSPLHRIIQEKKVDQYLTAINALHEVNPIYVIRLTGGEPLLFKPIERLIKGIVKLGIKEVRITTNAVYLKKKAQMLYNAGIRNVNISLDAIDSDIFEKMTRYNHLDKVLEGIDEALRVGMKIKLNAVIMKGHNDNQIIGLLEYAMKKKITIRFLETMTMGHLYEQYGERLIFKEKDILDTIKKKYSFIVVQRKKSATSRYWKISDDFQFGIIANQSTPFCSDCDRLRLDHKGNIYGCLSDVTPVPFNNLASASKKRQSLYKALEQKQTNGFKGSKMSMKYIGG